MHPSDRAVHDDICSISSFRRLWPEEKGALPLSTTGAGTGTRAVDMAASQLRLLSRWENESDKSQKNHNKLTAQNMEVQTKC